MKLVSERILNNYIYDQERSIWTPPGQSSVFKYSDGDEVEQRLFNIVSCASDLGSTSLELRNQITDWPSKYHLSPRRSNLLRPLSDMLNGRILEIGAGCGAITRFLCETGSDVFAVEGSRRRAAVVAARCRDLQNVTVIADAFHNIPVIPEFDVITLIGVLEYARKYFPSVSCDPVNAMLMHARRFLRPGGILIVAIENQLGLKYFAGYREDHVGLSMFGIEDRYSQESVVTFGRRELQARITAAGLNQQQFWFPFPDYKLPVSVLSDRLLDLDIDVDVSPILSNSVSRDPQAPEHLMFSLEQAWQPVARNRLFGDLANSFLVVASEQIFRPSDDKVLAYHYSVDRRMEFAKEVRFDVVNDRVMACKRLLFPKIKPSSELPISIVLKDEHFLSGIHWQNNLIRIVNTPGWSYLEVGAWAEVWFMALLDEVGLSDDRHQLSAHHLLPGSFFDAVPQNLIVGNDSKPKFFDQEWQLDPPIEIACVLFRGLLHSLTPIHSCAEPATNTSTRFIDLFFKTAQYLGINVTDDDVANYVKYESNIESWVSNCSWTTLDTLQLHVFPVRQQIKSNFYHDNRLQGDCKLDNEVNLLRKQVDSLQKALLKQTSLSETFDSKLREILCSMSWRITKQLRVIYGLLRKVWKV